jgi:hypothetical protein
MASGRREGKVDNEGEIECRWECEGFSLGGIMWSTVVERADENIGTNDISLRYRIRRSNGKADAAATAAEASN